MAMRFSERHGLTALRILVASQMVIHGSYRTVAGGVILFGSWLAESGFPGGHATAILITSVEILGGLTLITGRLVRPLALWFAAQLIVGVAMVHYPEGWFVVGGGRNGMEYSVVLIGGFLIVALTTTRPAPPTRGRPEGA